MKRVSELAQTFCDSTKGRKYSIDETVFACYLLAATALKQGKGIKFTRDECFDKLIETTRTFLEHDDGQSYTKQNTRNYGKD